MEQPIASTSATRLDTPPAHADDSGRGTPIDGSMLADKADEPETEPIPSLASLLLSTAESLAARSRNAPAVSAPDRPKKLLGVGAGSSGPGKASSPAAAFTLSTSPDALLSHPAAPPYLASLLAQPLSEIEALPASLANLSTTLDQDLSSLAYTRYSAFLQSHAAAQSISTLFTSLSDSLSALLDSTLSLEQAATAFGSKIDSVRDKRERMARVRDRIAEVEELLDAPSVVDACVRAGYWSEAIDVASRLENLHKRLLANSGTGFDSTRSSEDGFVEGQGARALLDRIRGEVNLALLSLRTRVLESLVQRSLKLPSAVRAIGVLRRISERGLAADHRKKSGDGPKTFSEGRRVELDEDALRVVFLVARWKCLRNELGGVEAQMTAAGIQLGKDGDAHVIAAKQDLQVSAEENDERARWTKRWIEVWREIVGETITTYAEVFLGSSAPLKAASDGNADQKVRAHALSPTAPLHLFLSTALDLLSNILVRAIAGLNAASALSSIVTQLTYCSHSFARYGLDFRQMIQLRERVELRIGRIVALEWEAAGRKWEKEWRDAWGHSGGAIMTAAKARRNGRVPLTDWLVVPEGLSTALSTPVPPAPTSYTKPAEAWHHQPSPSIALFPPLARFLNAQATALNSLRLLPPVALYTPLRRAQAVELDRATQVLSAFTDAWLAAIASTPLVDSTGFDTATPTVNGAECGVTTEDQVIAREREAERKAVAAAIAWFGRSVVPWCAAALESGVYAELVQSGRVGDAGLADGVKEARRRCEQLIAKIEGRDYAEPTSAAKAVSSESADLSDDAKAKLRSPPPIVTELPVIDPEAAVSAAPSSLATPTSSLAPDSALNGVTSKPADFLVSPLDGNDGEDFAIPDVAVSGAGDEADAPYVVPDKAPPPPVAAGVSPSLPSQSDTATASEAP
ncbi:hypothetical protein BMF94_4343 [Rhodotorula taiwanensis]|uniref:Conserved oligomeric Golgi complex subunit 8 n=1 Tax=Rhodotorula taiwanensis TaxID=741276 RepID=A0A2S5B6X5_9BASI|nr:hypothetical protein BMF94_4343 [Rhodotorula taiwanensis]